MATPFCLSGDPAILLLGWQDRWGVCRENQSWTGLKTDGKGQPIGQQVQQVFDKIGG
jgi:hypothetical protein